MPRFVRASNACPGVLFALNSFVFWPQNSESGMEEHLVFVKPKEGPVAQAWCANA